MDLEITKQFYLRWKHHVRFIAVEVAGRDEN